MLRLKFHHLIAFTFLLILTTCNENSADKKKAIDIHNCPKHKVFFKNRIGSFCPDDKKDVLVNLFNVCETIFWREHLKDGEIPLTRPKSIDTGIFNNQRVFYKLLQINEEAEYEKTSELIFDSVALYNCDGEVVKFLPWKNLSKIKNSSVLFYIGS